MRIYIFGRIEYRDAFHEQPNRWTTFCFGMKASDDATIRKLTTNYEERDLEVTFEAAPVGNDSN